MEELKSYLKHDVPAEIAWQIVSYQRIQWPFLYGKSNKGWDFSPRENAPVSFVMSDGGMLISHAAVNQRRIEFVGQSYNCFGVSSVFTYPAFRKGGYASRVVTAATQHILGSDADLAMLFCGQPLRTFYTSCGWSAADNAAIFYGEADKPTRKSDNLVMMLFVSEKAKRVRDAFEREPVFVGPVTW